MYNILYVINTSIIELIRGLCKLSAGLSVSGPQGLDAGVPGSSDIYLKIYLVNNFFMNVVCFNTYVCG